MGLLVEGVFFEGLVDVGEHAGEQLAQGIAHFFIRAPARAEGVAHVAVAQRVVGR